MTSTQQITTSIGRLRSPRWVALVSVALIVIGLAVVAPAALIVVFLDGLAAGLVLAPAALGGLWFAGLLKLDHLPIRWHLLIGAALGIGALSLAVLIAGLLGILDRLVWVSVLALAGVVGLVRLRELIELHNEPSSRRLGDVPQAATWWRWLLLLICPFAVLALLATTAAPGFLWTHEGFGYDVLEYHLQVPKEYYLAGKIDYLPHNVYANFPSNVEMLYLLAMVVLEDASNVGTVAHMIHLYLAALAVFAAWVAGCEWSPRAGIVSALAMGTVGWLPYLSGLAYVEHGLLFFSMVAVAMLLRAKPNQSRGWLVGCGLTAGLAAGCKYTGLVMVLAPLVLLAGTGHFGTLASRFRAVGTVFVATLITLGPWLIKNQCMTGNPVFPLANTVFRASPPGWGDSETQQWDSAHRPPEHARTIASRFGAFWQQVVSDRYHRFGPMIFVVALLGLGSRRLGRSDMLLLLLLLCQVFVWLAFTHLFARFAVVLLVPLCLLCGRVFVEQARRSIMLPAICALIAGTGWNLAHTARLFRAEHVGPAPGALIYSGKIPGYEYFDVVNRTLDDQAKLLLLGDAKAFYYQRAVSYYVCFNRNPFFELIRRGADGAELLAWLRAEGYSHVLVHYGEIRRISGTYKFSPPVEPQEVERAMEALVRAGATLAYTFDHPTGSSRYVELLAIRP